MPKIVDKAARQQDLIQAALQVFAEQGYHRATMQAVADRAGVSKGGIYDYFESKEDLLLRMTEWLETVLFEQSVLVLETATGDIASRIRLFVSALAADLDSWTDVCFVVLQIWAELGRDEDRPLRALMSDLYASSIDRVQAVFDDAVARGEAEPFPTRAAALAMLAALDGCMLQGLLMPGDYRAGMDTGVFADWCASIVPLRTTEVPT